MIDFPTTLNDAIDYVPVAAPVDVDSDLRARIGIALARRQRTAWRVVRVLARHGIVTLQGTVPTYYDRQVILAVTQHVAGVRRVDDELSVAEARAATDPAAEVEDSGDDTKLEASEPSPDPVLKSLQQIFERLPVLSPSLEEILAARDGSAPAEL